MTDLRRVTERIEREEFARGHIGPGERPAEPRPAATIVLASSAFDGGPRVLLLRRPETTRFAAGAHVFAGGVIDPSDSDPQAIGRLPLSLRGEEGPAAVAALRELFEETGILPADRPVDPVLALRVRENLLEDREDFTAAAARLDATFHRLRAAYFARWITPARFARRYDTRFFLAVLGDDTAPEPVLTDELDGHLWIEAAEAVRRFAAGQLPMLFPTRRTLQSLAAEGDLDALIRRCHGRLPEPIEPRLVVQGDSVRPVLPGDPEYDEAG